MTKKKTSTKKPTSATKKATPTKTTKATSAKKPTTRKAPTKTTTKKPATQSTKPTKSTQSKQTAKPQKSQRLVNCLAITVTILLVVAALLSVLSVIERNDQNNANNNNGEYIATDPEERMQQLRDQMAEIDAEIIEIAKTQSEEHYDTFVSFKERVAPFNRDAAENSDLKTNDLKIGDGEKIDINTRFTAYYIGWTADGNIFDTSILDNGFLNTPLSHVGDERWIIGNVTDGVIEGWNVGVRGMRIGGVREVTIPSDMAYGDREMIDIPANSPLKFIIMTIPINDRLEEIVRRRTSLQQEFNQLMVENHNSDWINQD